MRRELACLLLLASFGPFVCAQDPVQGLLAKDWRERNAAARALAAAPTLDVDALLKVMQTPEDEGGSSIGLGGGSGGRPDLFTAIEAECRQEAGLSVKPLDRQRDSFALRDTKDLVLPRAPAELAAWLLEGRPALRDRIRTRWHALQVQPTTLRLAKMWLTTSTPEIDEVVAAATKATSRLAVLEACARLQPDTLRTVILRSDPETQAAGLWICARFEETRRTTRTDVELHRTLASCFLQSTDPDLAARLGGALCDHGIAGLRAALTSGHDDLTARRRLAALAVVLAETQPIPIDAVAPLLDDEDPKVVERAMCALRNPAQDRDAARKLAGDLAARLAKTSDARQATFALHALAALGADVPADVSTMVRGWWTKLPWRRARPSVLLAMLRLGVADAVPVARQLATLAERESTQMCRDAVWNGIAELPDAGASALLELSPAGRDWTLPNVAAAAAKSHPTHLDAWLAEPTLRRHALAALAADAPARLPPFAELQAERATAAPSDADALTKVMARHPDAAAQLDAIAPAVLRTQPGEYGPFTDFLRDHHRALPLERRLELLHEHLPRGVGWWLVQDAPASRVLPRLRTWFDASTEPEVRGILCAEIARFGDASDEGRIVAQLATEHCHSLLRQLEAAPTLSAAVRAAIERLADAQLRGDPLYVGPPVLAVLWAHRQR